MREPVLQRIVDRFLGGTISGPIAVMEMLLATTDADAVARAVSIEIGGEDATRMTELRGLVVAHAKGCATIETMLRTGLDSPAPAATVDDGIDRARRLFDDSVTRSEESSVALYSLGSAALLEAATEEAVAVMRAWHVLGPQRDALEIGCGVGRFLVPLAAHVRTLVGTDISPNMVAAAQRRTRELTNVRVELTDGHDLRASGEASFDLVYCVDVFPYIVLAGRALVEMHLREVARVLRRNGNFVIFNYAYGRDRAEDAREVRELATANGLEVIRSDETPFAMWNGIAFQLRRP